MTSNESNNNFFNHSKLIKTCDVLLKNNIITKIKNDAI